jgi:hypothetical protein
MGEACSAYRERKGVYRVLAGKQEGRDHLKDAGLDVRIILRWIFKQWNGGCGPD